MYLKRILPTVLAASMLFCTTSCASGTGSSDTTSETKAPSADTVIEDTTAADTTAADTTAAVAPRKYSKDENLNVLLIGNSLTYFHSMNLPDGTFANIAHEAGYTGVNVTSYYSGGYYLHQFLDPENEHGAKVLEALKSDTKYDIVVIQDYCDNPMADPADFYDCCREFKKLVDANGGQLWLYASTSYFDGNELVAQFGKDTMDLQMKMAAGYTAIGEELGVPVVYAGYAVTKAYLEDPVMVVDNDHLHPTPEGMYIVACTLFGTIFGEDPETITYRGRIPERETPFLRAAAADVVKNGITIPEKYKVSSVGVTKVAAE